MSSLTFGSLFSGVGGMDLGLERAGLLCKWRCEINPYCRNILSRHWPGVPVFSDATKLARRTYDCTEENDDGEVICPRCGVEFGDCDCIRVDQLLDEHGPVDLICGGDPCQENSNARRTGETTSPSLGGEFIRIVEQLMPRLVLRENPATVRKDAPWPWWRFRSELERLGYVCVPFRLRACCLGADFRRERLFVLAELPSAERPRLEGDVGQIMERERERRQDTDAARPDRWSATPRICGRADRVPNRMERIKGLGNAIPPVMGKWIGKMILEGCADV